jgi:hypothetical protein
MAPEAQGAQVLLDLDYRPKNMFIPHQNRTGLQLLFYKFSACCTVEAVDAPQTKFRAL